MAGTSHRGDPEQKVWSFPKQGRVHGPLGSIVFQRAKWMFWFECEMPITGSCIGTTGLWMVVVFGRGTLAGGNGHLGWVLRF